jgi:hypothetical protein
MLQRSIVKRVIPNIIDGSNHSISSVTKDKLNPAIENESLLTLKVEYDSISEDGIFSPILIL